MYAPLGENDLRNSFFRKQLVCEFLGTFLLMWVRKITVTVESAEWAVTKVAFSLGLTIAVLTKAFSRISGCHINPAISLAFFIVGEMRTLRFFCYVIAHCLGAITAVFFYKAYAFAVSSDEEYVSSNLDAGQRILLEMILTMMYTLLFRTMANSQHRKLRTSTSMATGFAYVACLLSGISHSETTINPVLHFAAGPNLLSGDWMAAIGALLGGVGGSLLYEFFYTPERRPSIIFE